MNFEKDFLPQDIPAAKKEYYCIKACEARMDACLEHGDLAEVKLTALDITKSVIALESLKHKKRQREREYLAHLLVVGALRR